MKRKEQYNNFKYNILQKINKASEDIHIGIQNKNFIFKFLCKHEYIINNAGVDFNKLREINDNPINSNFYLLKNIKYTDDEILNSIIQSNLNTFIYLGSIKIDSLLNYISYMNYIYNITYTVYLNLIKEFNKAIVKTLIEGDTYTFGFGLSSINIKRIKRRRNSKLVNWGKTNKNKKKIIETTDDKKNYVEYYDSPYFNFVYWNKSNSTITNHIFYNFKVTNFTNVGDRNINSYYSKITSLNEVLDEDRIGVIQKINCAIKLNPELVNLYLNN